MRNMKLDGRLLLAVLGMALICQSSCREAPASRARDFLDSIGVNTHLSYIDSNYVDAGKVLTGIRYLGVTTVRDYGLQADGRGRKSYGLLADAGIKFDMFIFGWPIDSAVEQI